MAFGMELLFQFYGLRDFIFSTMISFCVYMTTKVSDQCYDLRVKGQGQICMKISFMAGWPLGFRLWCPSVSLSLSDWYPGSGLVLECIDSWSLQPYLLCNANSSYIAQWKMFIFGIIIAYGV